MGGALRVCLSVCLSRLVLSRLGFAFVSFAGRVVDRGWVVDVKDGMGGKRWWEGAWYVCWPKCATRKLKLRRSQS